MKHPWAAAMTPAFIPGLGMQEILLLGMCFMMLVVPLVVVLVVLKMNHKPDKSDRIRELEEENRRLRDERSAGDPS
jgi:hypothetical protein